MNEHSYQAVVDCLEAHEITEKNFDAVMDWTKSVQVNVEAEKAVESLLMEKMTDFCQGNMQRQSKVTFVIGPSGGGKTCVAAGLALQDYLHDKKRSVLVAADTYKTGGMEQLKELAKPAEATFYVVKTIDDIKSIMRKNQEQKHVIVDTTFYIKDRSRADWDMYFQNIYDAFGGFEREILLVLPLSGNERYLKDIADHIAEKYDFSLVITKMDETENLETIYKLCEHIKKPIKYVKDGPSIGFDMREFDIKQYVTELMHEA